MHYRLFSFFSLLLLFLVSLVTPPSNVSAEEIVVTATPIKDESPASVAGKSPTSFTQTVKVNPLAKGLTSTLGALRLSGNADLPEYGQSYLPATVSLRGAKDQQTLIMLDGVPLTSSLGDPIDLSFYPIPEIDRIEIVKGSNSAAYGSSAMGGVVNIVSKDPGMEDSAELTASKGTYGYNLYNILANTGTKDVRLMLNATRSWGDNDFTYERPDGTDQRRDNNDFVQTSLLSKLWFDAGGWDTTLTGSLSNGKSGSPGGEGGGGMYLTPDDEVEANQYFLLGNTARDFGESGNLVVKIARQHTRTHNTYDSMWVTGDSWTELTSDYLDLIYTRRQGILTLSPEITWRREDLSSDQYGMHSRSTGSGSLGSAIDLGPVLLSLAVRYDDSSAFDGRLSYHGGAAWKVAPHVTLKANAGTGYHEPTMAHLYSPSSFTTFISNPDLKPEESFGFDLGPEIEFERFGCGASYFVTRYDDLIKMEYDMGANSITYVNVDKAHASGIEAHAWVRPADPVKLSAGYALSSFRNGSGAFESKNLALKPGQIITLQADWMPVVFDRKTDLFLAYQFREGAYEDEANTEKTGDRNILDAGLAVELVRHAIVAFKVNNIFNDESVEYKSGDYWLPVPGRTYRGSLQVSF